MNYRHGFALLDNARAFLESAVDLVRRAEAEEKRFAILHLVTALELLLKARIAMKDPRLLVRGKPVTEEAFERGDFKSVGMEEAIKLLTSKGLLCLSARQLNQLTTLRNMRNRTTHFVDGANTVEARAAIGAGVHLFIEIHNAEFTDDEVCRTYPMQKVAEELSRCDEFVNERLGHLGGHLHGSARPRTHYFDECHNCLQDAAVIIEESIRCLFCGATVAIRDHAQLISEDSTVAPCPECKRDSVACHCRGGKESTYECICCGYFRGPEIHWADQSGPIPRLREPN